MNDPIECHRVVVERQRPDIVGPLRDMLAERSDYAYRIGWIETSLMDLACSRRAGYQQADNRLGGASNNPVGLSAQYLLEYDKSRPGGETGYRSYGLFEQVWSASAQGIVSTLRTALE